MFYYLLGSEANLMNNKSQNIISVIMSVYKPEEEYLREAIESILNQTFKEFEYIIIIDGIDKLTSSIIKSFNDDRIKVYQNEKNLGLTKSLNIGLQLATGKYIARMDADDISFPKRLEKQYEYMEKNKDVAVCGCYAKNIGKKGFAKQLWSYNEDVLKIRMMFYNAGIIHPTAFIRKETLQNNNIKYDEAIKKSQDYALWVDILRYSKIMVIPDVLLGYRRHKNQIISSNSNEVEEYTNIIRIREWSNIGVNFNTYEKSILKSISEQYAEISSKEYDQLFKKLIAWNNKHKYFNEKLFLAEINRLWIHTALKRIRNEKKCDMIFKPRTFELLKPNTFRYCFNFYFIDKIKPYFYKNLKLSMK